MCIEEEKVFLLHHLSFLHIFFLCFLLIAKSCQINQSKKFGLLSELALSSQTKFFLKSPPKFRKKAEADQAMELPNADLGAELDSEAEASESQSPIGQYENCLSAGLDCAISDLVSLDSQAEVEQGTLLWEGTDKNQHSSFGAVSDSMPLCLNIHSYLIFDILSDRIM